MNDGFPYPILQGASKKVGPCLETSEPGQPRSGAKLNPVGVGVAVHLDPALALVHAQALPG